MYAEHPECDFTQYPPLRTMCEQCGRVVNQSRAVVRSFFWAGREVQEHFCSDQCMNAWEAECVNGRSA